MTETDRLDEFPHAVPSSISRRTALRFGALGVGAIAVTSGLSSCAGPAPTTDKSPAAGGTFQGALALPFTALDPAVATAEDTIAVNDLVYESLYRYGKLAPFELAPELASEMPRQVDPTTYRISLRQGVKFHDGSALTADDVVFTIERLLDPKTQSSSSTILSFIKKLRTISPNEIELTVSKATGLLANRLSVAQVLSKSAVATSPDTLKYAPVGSGPYGIGSVAPGQNITLNRFANYTGKRKVVYDTIKLNVISDPTARVAALRTGQVSAMEAVPYNVFSGLARDSSYKAKAVSAAEHTYFFFNCAKPPFVDARVRRAVLYSIDRDFITQSVFFGQAQPAWSGEIRPTDPGYVRPQTIYRYDPDFARQLMAQAGYSRTSIPIDITISADISYLAAQAPIFQENLAAIGFAPNVVPLTNSSQGARLVTGDFNIGVGAGGTSATDPTVEYYLRSFYQGQLPQTILGWNTAESTKVTQLLETAFFAPDDATRHTYLADVQNIVQDEVPLATLHFNDQLTAWSNSLSNFTPLGHYGFALDGTNG
jgi:peptide/nickel transport system substrate-binding protein